MPEISRFYGIIITMYFPDHNPPHFHAKYNEFRAIIEIATGKTMGTMPRHASKMIEEWRNSHKEELFDNWRRMENGKPLNTIKPLE